MAMRRNSQGKSIAGIQGKVEPQSCAASQCPDDNCRHRHLSRHPRHWRSTAGDESGSLPAGLCRWWREESGSLLRPWQHLGPPERRSSSKSLLIQSVGFGVDCSELQGLCFPLQLVVGRLQESTDAIDPPITCEFSVST
jgi:hypothetical protein